MAIAAKGYSSTAQRRGQGRASCSAHRVPLSEQEKGTATGQKRTKMGLPTLERASELPQQIKDAILEYVGDLPPFGVHLFVLQLRLEKQWGSIVKREAIEEYLKRYYGLEEWRKRYQQSELLSPYLKPQDFELPSEEEEQLLQEYRLDHSHSSQASASTTTTSSKSGNSLTTTFSSHPGRRPGKRTAEEEEDEEGGGTKRAKRGRPPLAVIKRGRDDDDDEEDNGYRHGHYHQHHSSRRLILPRD